jgi:hypothetical protein
MGGHSFAAALLAALAAGAGCGRTEPTLDCDDTGRRVIFVESFEDETAATAYSGAAARERRPDAIAGSFVAAVFDGEGSVRTTAPVRVEGEGVLVGFHLLAQATRGTPGLACSWDGGATFTPTPDVLPSLDLVRDEWIYVEALCPLPAPGGEVTVELSGRELDPFSAGWPAFQVDLLSLIEPSSCAAEVSPVCVASERRLLYVNDLESSDPRIAITGDWEVTSSPTNAHSGAILYELWQGAGDLRFTEPITPQRTSLVVSLWLQHPQTTSLALRIALSTDGGVTYPSNVPLAASLVVDRIEWTNVETIVPVTPNASVSLALQAAGNLGTPVGPVRIDDVSFSEAGACP